MHTLHNQCQDIPHLSSMSLILLPAKPITRTDAKVFAIIDKVTAGKEMATQITRMFATTFGRKDVDCENHGYLATKPRKTVASGPEVAPIDATSPM